MLMDLMPCDQAACWMGGYWNETGGDALLVMDQAACWMGGYWKR